MGAIVFQREWSGFADQKRFALSKAKYPWIISIDADERISDTLRDEIIHSLNRNPSQSGFYIPRKSYFLGKWIRYGGWYPGYVMRFFQKERATLPDVQVHEGFLVEGSIGYLKGDILHNTHPSIHHSLEKMARCNHWIALERIQRGHKKVRWYDLIIHPFAAFSKKFFSKIGFLDGLYGFILALLDVVNKLSLYLAIWDLQHEKEKKKKLEKFYQ